MEYLIFIVLKYVATVLGTIQNGSWSLIEKWIVKELKY